MIALPEFWGKWLLPRSFRTDTELLHWRFLQHTLLGRFDWLIRSHSQFNNQGTLTSIENHSVVFDCNCDKRFRPVISTCTVELLHISIKNILKISKYIAQISDYIWPHLTSSFSLGMSHNANRRWTLLVKPHTSHLSHCHSMPQQAANARVEPLW